jgi:hydroxyacylglutathione hydrolase
VVKVVPVAALKDNYIWAIINDAAKTAVIVDPGEAKPILDFLTENHLTCAAILITHHHADHIAGIGEVYTEFKCPVYAPAVNQIAGTTHLLNGGEQIILEAVGLTFEVMAIPGHTLGHLAYYSAPYLFCGDTLFSVGCGRCFEGTLETMHASLMTLAALPDNTIVCCTHEYTLANICFALHVEPDNATLHAYQTKVQALRDTGTPSLPSTLGLEKQVNPFLRTAVAAVKAAAEAHAGHSLASPAAVFAELRTWKDSF